MAGIAGLLQLLRRPSSSDSVFSSQYSTTTTPTRSAIWHQIAKRPANIAAIEIETTSFRNPLPLNLRPRCSPKRGSIAFMVCKTIGPDRIGTDQNAKGTAMHEAGRAMVAVIGENGKTQRIEIVTPDCRVPFHHFTRKD
ncbi:hypothetical protein ACRQ1B_11970 [Rhizobium panacihumi]|uniref:hypothetical protein n=1 Tax=Rhizobium panacihumi TaxID=2008450 RepID=UPI003D79EB9C